MLHPLKHHVPLQSENNQCMHQSLSGILVFGLIFFLIWERRLSSGIFTSQVTNAFNKSQNPCTGARFWILWAYSRQWCAIKRTSKCHISAVHPRLWILIKIPITPIKEWHNQCRFVVVIQHSELYFAIVEFWKKHAYSKFHPANLVFVKPV